MADVTLAYESVAFERLNAVKKSNYQAFLRSLLGEWYWAARRVCAAPTQRDDKEPVGKALIAAGAQAVDGVSSSTFTFPLE